MAEGNNFSNWKPKESADWRDAVLKYGNDWNKVATDVSTRSA